MALSEFTFLIRYVNFLIINMARSRDEWRLAANAISCTEQRIGLRFNPTVPDGLCGRVPRLTSGMAKVKEASLDGSW